jgi:hypothetical protein
VKTKAKKRTWFWAECDVCPGWQSPAVQSKATAQKAADAHRERLNRRGRAVHPRGSGWSDAVTHRAKVVNPTDG